MHVHIASDTQTIQSFDWSKWGCTLWCYVISRHISNQTSFPMVCQTGCWYVNCCWRQEVSALSRERNNYILQCEKNKQAAIDFESRYHTQCCLLFIYDVYMINMKKTFSFYVLFLFFKRLLYCFSKMIFFYSYVLYKNTFRELSLNIFHLPGCVLDWQQSRTSLAGWWMIWMRARDTPRVSSRNWCSCAS